MGGLRHYRKHLVSVLLILVVSTCWTTARTGQIPVVGIVVGHSSPGSYAISRFIDGDTIAVDMDGRAEKVRFIGVDTPETHKPDTPVQCYGPEASAYTEHLIGHGRVRLVSDPLSTDRDRYGRLLRYVYLQNGTLLNEKLVADGYGFYYPYFPFSKSTVFKADEQTAQRGDKGLWHACKPTPTDAGGYVSNPRN